MKPTYTSSSISLLTGQTGNYVKNPTYTPGDPSSNRYVDRSKLTIGLNPVDAKIESYAGKDNLSRLLGTSLTKSQNSPLFSMPINGIPGVTPKPTTVKSTPTPATPTPVTPATVSSTGRNSTITAPVQTNPATPSYDPSVTGQAINPSRLSGDELKDLARRAGEAGLSLTDYTELVNANAGLSTADSDKIRTELGVDTQRDKVFSTPEKSLEDTYQELYKTTGLTDIKKRMEEIDARLNQKRDDFTKVEGEIRNNPWLSSASRRGRLATAASLALADIENDLTERQQYLDLYDTGVSDIERRLGYIISDRNLDREIDTEKLNYLLNEAERREGLQVSDNVAAGLRNVPDFIAGRRDEQMRIENQERADAAAKIAASAVEVPVLRMDEAGNVLMGTEPPKPPTEGERQTLIFFQRMADAVSNLDAVEEEISKTGLLGQAQMAVFDMPLFLTKNQQKYEQAARAFTEARLRKDSGAAIPESEYEADRKTYFPQPGDDVLTLQQKAQSRKVAINGLRVASGNAYWQLYGVNPVEETIARLQQSGTTGGGKATEADRAYTSTLNLNR